MSAPTLDRGVGHDPGRRTVAIVGSGVSGLVTAALRHDRHDGTVFEGGRARRVGHYLGAPGR